MLPNSATLASALLDVLKQNPTGLKSKEIDRLAAEKLGLTDADLKIIRTGTRTEFAYRMAWERTHAKAKGYIVRNDLRVWVITDIGNTTR